MHAVVSEARRGPYSLHEVSQSSSAIPFPPCNAHYRACVMCASSEGVTREHNIIHAHTRLGVANIFFAWSFHASEESLCGFIVLFSSWYKQSLSYVIFCVCSMLVGLRGTDETPQLTPHRCQMKWNDLLHSMETPLSTFFIEMGLKKGDSDWRCRGCEVSW